jgi:hypothetical protein
MITPEESRAPECVSHPFPQLALGGIETKCGRGKARLFGLIGEPVQGALRSAEVLAAPVARAAKTSSSQSGRISGTDDRSNSV